jgi:hypothetical protein
MKGKLAARCLPLQKFALQGSDKTGYKAGNVNGMEPGGEKRTGLIFGEIVPL